VDIVEAWDGDRLGRAWINVISAAEMARSGKAIVIAGRPSSDDPLWPTTDYLANLAYNSLLYRGYAKNNLQYLSPVTSQDVDGNGVLDDIAGPSTLSAAAFTFTNWAMANPDCLFIYLVDHGGSSSGAGYFRLNDTEFLTAADLGHWLDAIQNRFTNDVVVVIDCCESGSFLDALKYSGPGKRTVITACATNEPTYFVAGGLVSFSDAFFCGLLSGSDVQAAFDFARNAMSPYQSAWLDADGNGVYDPAADLPLAAGEYIGASFVAGKDVPEIGHVMGDQALNGATASTLWAYDIASAYPLDQVWCLVVPPSHQPNPTNPVADLPVLNLEYNPDTGRYEAQYSGFSEVGTYKLVYYAQDIWGSVSLPRQSYVQQNGYQEKIILVAGGDTNSASWAGIDNLAQLAYHTFRGRLFAPAAISYLSPLAYEDVEQNGTNAVAALSTAGNLGYAITNWATGANKLTVYLVGDGTNNLFRLNATETLAPADFKAWLDVYQNSNGEAQVVMDFPGSGAYLPPLRAASRICLASARADQNCVFANGGMVSFSRFFLPDIFSGCNLGQAFSLAKNAIRQASGQLRQEAQLDDNGDGVANKLDGSIAASKYIGPAFLTGADGPAIGSVIPDITLIGTNTLLLWAQDVVAVAGISNVWCVITPPDYDGQGNLPQTNLTWNAGTSRYEALFTNFTQPGTYVCTFFAVDVNGVISAPRQMQVMTADAFEPDDSAAQATIFQLSDTQQHNFHTAVDEDWVKFYAPTGWIYEIDAQQLGTNSDVRLDLYYEQSDGTLASVDFVDDHVFGADVTESLTLDLKSGQSGWSEGVYYVRVSSADTNRFGPGSEYELSIYMPAGGAGGVVLFGSSGGFLPMGSFNVCLGPTQALAAGAGWRVQQLTNQNYFSNNSVVYSLPASSGYTLSFRSIPGFLAPANRSLVIKADKTTSVMTYYLYTNVSPRAASPVLGAGGVFQLTYLAYAGKRYAIQESTNLLNWVPLVTNKVPQDGLLHFNKTNSSTKGRAFYRARYVP
jgi:hypothetical protein